MTSIIKDIADLLEHMNMIIEQKVMVASDGHVAPGHHPSEVAARTKTLLLSIIDRIEALERLRDGQDVIMPKSREHAKAMILIAEAYLKANP